jgi:epoxyqueuosine reductase
MIDVLSEEARRLGFIAIGFSRPRVPPYFQAFKSWIARGDHAGMNWLEKHTTIREDPTRLLEGCRTIISLAYPYSAEKPCTADGFSVSRYARPDQADYHDRLRGLCRPLTTLITSSGARARTRVCVDSAPILERSFAQAAGIGFFGKNNALIIPGYGSYFYLTEILTTAAWECPPARPMENRCESCVRCLEACPTGALEAPFRMDASKCLAYLTIEHPGPIKKAFAADMGDCFFGCDRCLEACPFNGTETGEGVVLPATEAFLEMTEDEFQGRFGRSALGRAGLSKIQENIRMAQGARRKAQGKNSEE